MGRTLESTNLRIVDGFALYAKNVLRYLSGVFMKAPKGGVEEKRIRLKVSQEEVETPGLDGGIHEGFACRGVAGLSRR